MNDLATRIILGAFSLFAIFCSCNDIANVQAERKIEWKEVPCTILESYVEYSGDGDTDVQHTLKLYLPRIKYSYTLAGRTYIGKEVWFSDPPGYSPVDAEAMRARLVANHRAFYNPDHSEQSVMIVNKVGKLGFTVVFLLVAIGLLFSSIFAFRRPKTIIAAKNIQGNRGK
jgi:hypothetical protein